MEKSLKKFKFYYQNCKKREKSCHYNIIANLAKPNPIKNRLDSQKNLSDGITDNQSNYEIAVYHGRERHQYSAHAETTIKLENSLNSKFLKANIP